MNPEYQAAHDYNTVGTNCNPYPEGSNDWIDYEDAFNNKCDEYERCQ